MYIIEIGRKKSNVICVQNRDNNNVYTVVSFSGPSLKEGRGLLTRLRQQLLASFPSLSLLLGLNSGTSSNNYNA